MIIVLAHVTVRAEQFDEALRMSRQHVERSRAEPGCLAHAVHRDAEHPLRLVFVEKWVDKAALQSHFRVPGSREFGKALAAMATDIQGPEIYAAEPQPGSVG
ncbi:putative quinol monooxygenase [Roseateles sp. BYS78W]|uniref:Quinol monooxygenase n=1 Tax=Pelomonas candidula TaxID=3299025 RepID=A0ABW7H9S5_9BURK